MGLAIEEQETNVIYMRDEQTAIIYTSDTTQMTKFDRLCRESPELYKFVENYKLGGEIVGKRYICMDKTLISYRKKQGKRDISDEERAKMGERLRKSREKSSQEGENDEV